MSTSTQNRALACCTHLHVSPSTVECFTLLLLLTCNSKLRLLLGKAALLVDTQALVMMSRSRNKAFVNIVTHLCCVTAEISLLELLGTDTLLNHGSVRRPVRRHWTVPLPPLLPLHHAGILLAAGLRPHLLQLLPQHHLLQVPSGGHRHCCAVCSCYDPWVRSLTMENASHGPQRLLRRGDFAIVL